MGMRGAKVLVVHQEEGAPAFGGQSDRGGFGHWKGAKETGDGFEAKRLSFIIFIGSRGTKGASSACQMRVSSHDGGWKMP